MTIRSALSRFDEEHRNQVPEHIKLEWLSFLDLTFYNDVVLTHESPSPAEFSGYTAATPDDTALLIPDPYSEVYLWYLSMRTDLYYDDVSRYNNHLLLYTKGYRDYENRYHATHKPLKKTEFFNV